jgi:hypothetical protein
MLQSCANCGYPTCSGRLKNGSPCMSVVVSLKSENELEQMYCAYHARKAALQLVSASESAPKDPAADESRTSWSSGSWEAG